MSIYKLTTAAILLAIISTFISCSDNDNIVNHYIAVKEKDQQLWSIMNYTTGEIIKREEYRDDQVPSIIQGEEFFTKDKDGYNYWNIKDLNNPLNEIPFLYATIFDNQSDRALVVTQEGKICIIDRNGDIKFTLPNEIRSATRLINGYSIVSDDNDNKGVINASGEYVIRPNYIEISQPSADGGIIATVEENYNQYSGETNKKYVVIKLNDTSFESLFSFNSSQYEDFGIFYKGFLPVQSDDDLILLDSYGNEVAQIGKCPYDESEDKLSISLIRVVDNKVQTFNSGYYGLKNIKTGETLIRNKYKKLIPIGIDRYIALRADDKFGVINSKDDPVNNIFDKTLILPLPSSENLMVVERIPNDDVNEKESDYSNSTYKAYITDQDFTRQKDPIYIDNLSFNFGENQLSNLFFDINKSINFIIAKITPQSFMGFHKDVKRNTLNNLWTVDNRWDKMFKSADGISTTEHRKYISHQGDYDYTLLFSDMENNDIDRVTFGAKYGIITFNVGSKKLGLEKELEKKLARELSKKGFIYTDELGAYVNNYTNTSVSLNYCSNGDFHIIYDFDCTKDSPIEINEIYEGYERTEIIKNIDQYNNEHNTGEYLPHDNSEYMDIVDSNKASRITSNTSSLSLTLSENKNSDNSFVSNALSVMAFWLLMKAIF